jgi:hypothetical protein
MYARAELVVPRSMPIFIGIRGQGSGIWAGGEQVSLIPDP